MKKNILINIALTSLGGLGGAAFFGALYFAGILGGQEATHFSSLSDLRQSMKKRDARDVKADGSVSLRTIIEPHESDDLIYTLKPNIDVKFQGVRVTTNSFGMRNPEISKNTAAGTYRIAVLGDSFTFGWGVDENKTFVRETERRLNNYVNSENSKLKTFTKVEVLNFGVPGYSTFQEVALFHEKVKQFKPDLVLVYFIENDFGLPFFIGTKGTLRNSVSWVRTIYASPNGQEDDEYRSLIARADANRALLSLDEHLFRNDIAFGLVFNPGKNEGSMRKKLWALRKMHHFKSIRLLPGVRKLTELRQLKSEQLRLPDDPHPSAAKHSLLAEVITKKVIKKFF